VIFGGGDVGERKARLFSSHAEVTVASLDFSPGILKMAEDGAIELVKLDLSQGADDFLRGAFIAIPATSDPALNLQLEERAGRWGFW
jgi:precorrin-2 dehydrogenase/sirohydrochlorin ferrochelatase